MCISRKERILPNHRDPKRGRRLNKPKIQVLGLALIRGKKNGKDMKLENLKLYLENKSIVEENEKLRKQANLLHQENLALVSELQKKFRNFCRYLPQSITAF